jgi:hypothetical protein
MRFKSFLVQEGFLKEAPLDAGDVKPVADRYARNNMVLWKDSQAVSNKGNTIIRKYNHTYSIWVSGKCVFAARVLDMSEGQFEIDNLWTDSGSRGQGYLTKFINFVFSDLGAKVVLLGNRHSDDTKNLLKGGGLSQFKKSWHNTRTGEQAKFDKDDIDKYYPKGSWQLAMVK